MASITDPTVVATMVQTVVITLTLIVFIFQFRSQEKALRESSYQNLLGRYNEFILSGDSADNRLLTRLFMAGSDSNEEPSEEDLAAMRRLMIAYGIIEEAFELYNKGWIDKPTWDQWGAWLEAIAQHPSFSALHRAAMGMFDKDFQDHVSRMLSSGPKPGE